MSPLSTTSDGYLVIDFRYQGKRYRESVRKGGLRDTPANRRELNRASGEGVSAEPNLIERVPIGVRQTPSSDLRIGSKQWLREFKAALGRDDFDYATWFPHSKRARKLVAQKPVVPTLGDYFVTWLDTLEVSRATKADYMVLKSVFLDQVGPPRGYRATPERTPKESADRFSLGQKLLTAVTASDIRAVIKAYTATGKTYQPRKFLQKLKAMFAMAVEDGLCERNPALAVRNPKARTRREIVEPFSEIEMDRILEVANGKLHNHAGAHCGQPQADTSGLKPTRTDRRAFDTGTSQTRSLIVLMLGTGVGPGEATALRRKDVDLKRRRLSISGSYGRYGEQTTKTSTRTRVLDLSNAAVDALRAQMEAGNGKGSKDSQITANASRARGALRGTTEVDSWGARGVGDYRKLIGIGDREAPLFTGQHGRHLNFTWWRRSVWTPLLAAAKVRYRHPYMLRHTYAIRQLEAGVDPVTLARKMGHTGVAMVTTVYARWTNTPEVKADER